MAPTILAGFDGSEHGQDALALARRLAEVTRARLLVACAYHYDLFPNPVAVGDYDSFLRQAAEQTLSRAERLLAGFGPWERRTGGGSSLAAVLHRLAEEEEVDLVVVGSTHRGTLGRILPGSTAVRLLHGSPCSVAVAPLGYASRPDAWLATIGAAYDGSDEARIAVDSAAGLAERAGAALRIISVVNLPAHKDPGLTGGRRQQVLEAARAARADALKEVVVGIAPQIHTESVQREGEVGETLADESRGLDLLVMGSRAYGPLRGVLVGTVSGEVVRRAHCPILIAPRGVERPFGARAADWSSP